MSQRFHRWQVSRHERRLLRQRQPTLDATLFNYRTEPRFLKMNDGSVRVAGARYSVSAELWRERMEYLRHPDRRHSFIGSGQPIFVGGSTEDQSWPLRRAECSRCGEVREMSYFVDPTRVRDGWCRR